MDKELIVHPNKKLNQKTDLIENESETFLNQLITDMNKIMTENFGIGLAGPQIGFMKSIFVPSNFWAHWSRVNRSIVS